MRSYGYSCYFGFLFFCWRNDTITIRCLRNLICTKMHCAWIWRTNDISTISNGFFGFFFLSSENVNEQKRRLCEQWACTELNIHLVFDNFFFPFFFLFASSLKFLSSIFCCCCCPSSKLEMLDKSKPSVSFIKRIFISLHCWMLNFQFFLCVCCCWSSVFFF